MTSMKSFSSSVVAPELHALVYGRQTERCELYAEENQFTMVNPPLVPPNLGFTMLLKIEPKL